MRVRFFVLDAYAGSGLVRATFQTAALLIDEHDVDIVSVMRRRDEPRLPLDPRVPLRFLVDARPAPRMSRRVGGRVLRYGGSRLALPGDKRSGRNFTLLSDFRLVRAVREVHDGVVIGTRASINVALARFARPTVYAVAQEHQHLGLRHGELREAFATFYPRLDAVITLTPGDAAAYRALLPPTTLVRDIPNSLPNRVLPRASMDARVIVAAGRLVRQKGFDLLVAAFAEVHRQYPDWKLHIFGKGVERERLEAAIRDHGLQEAVVLRGYSASLLEDMAAVGSIFVLSSRFEGHPIVLLEAMSLGLPPVAFNCPTGPAEIIEDGSSGILVPPRKVHALAQRLAELIDDPTRRADMGTAARETAQNFSGSIVGPRWMSLLGELAERPLGQRRPSTRNRA